MAGTKKVTNTVDNSTPSTTVDNSKIMEMLESIQSQLNQVTIEKDKAIAEKLELEKQIKESNNAKDMDDPSRPIKIRSVYEGEWITLFTESGVNLKLTRVNPRATVRQSQLESMLRLNEGHFAKGRIAIEDSHFIESHPELSEVYSTMIDENTLKMIHTFDLKNLIEIYTNANNTFKKNITNAFIKGFIKGEEIAFRDTAKLKALSEVMGADLMDMINGVQETESLTDLYSK